MLTTNSPLQSQAIKAKFTVGASSVKRGDAVYQDSVNGKVFLGDASLLSTSFNLIGVVDDVQRFTGETVTVVLSGVVRGAFIGFAPGQTVWLTIDGASGDTLDQTPPQLDLQVQIKVGNAISATDLKVEISKPLEL